MSTQQVSTKGKNIQLKPCLSAEVQSLNYQLNSKLVGQKEAIDKFIAAYQVYLANLHNPYKPISSFLYLGPTGVGKSRFVEILAENFFGGEKNMLTIDCSEFSHSADIARLIGAPPGYLGHNDTPAFLNQRNITRYQTSDYPFTLLLFDEIEKANQALWQLLLGILDKGRLTLGNNQLVDLKNCFIFMTGNVGSFDIQKAFDCPTGFHKLGESVSEIPIEKMVLGEAQKTFSPEFLNRINYKIVFNSLSKKQISRIFDLEMEIINSRIIKNSSVDFDFKLSGKAKVFLIDKGFSKKCGGREIRRVLEEYFIFPLSSLLASNKISDDDILYITVKNEKLVFSKKQGEMVATNEL